MVSCASQVVKKVVKITTGVTNLGGFQLLYLIITVLKSHDLLKIKGLSLVEILFVKKTPLQDFLSNLNAVFPTNERH